MNIKKIETPIIKKSTGNLKAFKISNTKRVLKLNTQKESNRET